MRSSTESSGAESGGGPAESGGSPTDATVVSTRPPGIEASVAEIGQALEGRSLGPYRLEQFVG
ncbi:MAG: hypothetical protein EBZ59_01735, partial [Planctomycetia bacterium]|nr:hypothetical protein [Planctomycetia bacterium]